MSFVLCLSYGLLLPYFYLCLSHSHTHGRTSTYAETLPPLQHDWSRKKWSLKLLLLYNRGRHHHCWLPAVAHYLSPSFSSQPSRLHLSHTTALGVCIAPAASCDSLRHRQAEQLTPALVFPLWWLSHLSLVTASSVVSSRLVSRCRSDLTPSEKVPSYSNMSRKSHVLLFHVTT